MDFIHPSNVVFECNRCGLCCGDTPHKIRHILLLEREAEDIETTTGVKRELFCNEISGKSPYRFEMKKQADGKCGKCCFLKDNRCTIYNLRPLICRFYPFELKYSEDKGTHVFNVTAECPGICNGKIMTAADFEKLFLLAQERLG